MVERYFDLINLTFLNTLAAGIRLKDIRASHISPQDIRIFDTSWTLK